MGQLEPRGGSEGPAVERRRTNDFKRGIGGFDCCCEVRKESLLHEISLRDDVICKLEEALFDEEAAHRRGLHPGLETL